MFTRVIDAHPGGWLGGRSVFLDHAGLSARKLGGPSWNQRRSGLRHISPGSPGAGAQRACRRDHPAAALATARSVGPIKAPMTDWTGMEKPIRNGQQGTIQRSPRSLQIVGRQPMRVMTMRWRCADISIAACLHPAEAWGFGARITRGIRCVEQAYRFRAGDSVVPRCRGQLAVQLAGVRLDGVQRDVKLVADLPSR